MSLPMEFWGVEVKAGQPLKVDTDGKLLHLSQASLGESKSGEGSDFVPIHVKFGDQKLVLGTLSPETIPQLSLDLVFEKEFELFHNWTNGSVYFCGYLSSVHEDDGFSEEDSDTEEEGELELPATAAVNGNVKSKPVTAGAKQNQQPKPKVTLVEPMKVDQDDDSDDEEDEDDSSEEEGSDSEADSDDEDETPKKAESGKKRPAEPATKTPTPNKKAKPSTPQRTGDGKKGVHTATPHPAKQTGKQDKSKDQPQKSPGQLTCKSCSKTFNSDNALKSHSAAKHGAK